MARAAAPMLSGFRGRTSTIRQHNGMGFIVEGFYQQQQAGAQVRGRERLLTVE